MELTKKGDMTSLKYLTVFIFIITKSPTICTQASMFKGLMYVLKEIRTCYGRLKIAKSKVSKSKVSHEGEKLFCLTLPVTPPCPFRWSNTVPRKCNWKWAPINIHSVYIAGHESPALLKRRRAFFDVPFELIWKNGTEKAKRLNITSQSRRRIINPETSS